MSDLVELLRRPYGNLTGAERLQVAARIETLEAGFDEIIRHADSRNGAIDIARRALHGDSKG